MLGDGLKDALVRHPSHRLQAGRHGLRASPGPLGGLEKCCLAEIGKLLLSGCVP